MTLILQIMQMKIHPVPQKTPSCKVIERLQEYFGDMFTLFENNEIKANPEKCQLLVSKKKTSATVTSNNFKIIVNAVKVATSLKQNLLGVVIDDQLTFKSHICNMYKKASQKLNAP